jgi:predicted lipid carrier protein YhbT
MQAAEVVVHMPVPQPLVQEVLVAVAMVLCIQQDLPVHPTQVAGVVVVDIPVDLEINWVAEPAAQASLLFPTHLVTLT